MRPRFVRLASNNFGDDSIDDTYNWLEKNTSTGGWFVGRVGGCARRRFGPGIQGRPGGNPELRISTGPVLYVRGQSSGARLDVMFVCLGLLAQPHLHRFFEGQKTAPAKSQDGRNYINEWSSMHHQSDQERYQRSLGLPDHTSASQSSSLGLHRSHRTTACRHSTS